MTAITDPEFSIRNNHFILTEPYKLAAAYHAGASITRLNIQVPTWNAIGRFNVYPPNLTAAIPSPPQMMWLKEYAPTLPVNEEITLKNTSTASETDHAFIWLLPQDWTANLAQYASVIPVRCTFTATTVTAGWVTNVALTFEQSLRGGVYDVLAAQCQGTNSMLFRLIFPRNRMYHGRKLRPGFLCQNALGDKEEPWIYDRPFQLGIWGRFHTFEPPLAEVYSLSGASTAHEMRLWLGYLGDSTAPLDSYVSGGM